MSGWKLSIWARLLSQSGSRRCDGNDASVVSRGEAEDVPELALGGDDVGGPGDQVEIELFEPLGGFGDVGDGAAADDELGLLTVQDFLGEADGAVGAPELDVSLCEVPVLLLDGANVGHHFGLEPPDGCVGVQPLNHDICAIGLEADGSGRGLSGQRGRSQQGLGQSELNIGGIGGWPDEERAILVGPGDIMDDSDGSTGLGLLGKSGLKTERVVHGDDGELGSGQGERSTLHAVVKGLNGITPEDTGGEGGVELGESRRDLSFLDGGVINRLQRAGTEGAGDTCACTGVQGSGFEATDRDALGAEGNHANDLGIIQTDPDCLLELERPDLLRFGVIGRARLGDSRHLERHGRAQEIGSLDLLVLKRDPPQVVVGDGLGLIEVGKSLAPG
jgi:hypothetical protein